MKTTLCCLVAALSLGACVESTGGALVTFHAQASGPKDAVAGQPYGFGTNSGFEVKLTRAKLFVGALYLNQTNPSGYSQETACILPSLYTGQLRSGLTVDALDPAPQAFGAEGSGTDVPTTAAELWLTAGDVNADEDATVVLDVAGTATSDAGVWPFTGAFHIGANRQTPPSNSALPGSNPLCKQRIVSPIPASLQLSPGGTVHVTVNPEKWFDSVDFSRLAEDGADAGTYHFIDDDGTAGQPDVSLYNALRATTGPYTVSYTP
jgi:hypothetical protein